MNSLRLRKGWVLVFVIVSVLIASLLVTRTFVGKIVSTEVSPDSLCSIPEQGEETIDSITNGEIKLYSAATGQKTPLPNIGRVDLVARIMPYTLIFQQPGSACQHLQARTVQDLKPGQRVRVWSKSGVVLTSYPGMIPDTSFILIMP